MEGVQDNQPSFLKKRWLELKIGLSFWAPILIVGWLIKGFVESGLLLEAAIVLGMSWITGKVLMSRLKFVDWLVDKADKLFSKIPLLSYPWGWFIEARKWQHIKENAKGVVWVPGIARKSRSFGFLMNVIQLSMTDGTIQKRYQVFIPTVPVPVTGFLVDYAAADIMLTDLAIDETARMVMTGGMLSPNRPIRLTPLE